MLVGNGLTLVDGPDGGPRPTVVGERGDHYELVLVAEGSVKTTGQGGDPGCEHAVVVGDQDAHD